MSSAMQRIGLFIFKHPPAVKRMKTNDDKSVTDSHTKSVEDEAYNEKVVRSELLNSIERKTPAAKIMGI